MRKSSTSIRRSLSRAAGGSRGQGLVEYALILLLIALVVIAILQSIGTTTNDFYSTINSGMNH